MIEEEEENKKYFLMHLSYTHQMKTYYIYSLDICYTILQVCKNIFGHTRQ